MASRARTTRCNIVLESPAMIGVIADPAEHSVVREFFELFKTPWEFYRVDRNYDVLLCAGDSQVEDSAKLVLYYSGRNTHFDDARKAPLTYRQGHACVLSYRGSQIPIYGDTITFRGKENGPLTDDVSRECAVYLEKSADRTLARIGYDLFSEVRALLLVGQPPANAHLPALELHIALLRNLITECEIPLVEIPPVPDGFQFIACLTHDVDHPAIRHHKWDHTMFGFLYRATFGSLRKLMAGRMSIQDLLRNWMAALKLPFVYLGLAKDFWRGFDDQYLELENGVHSTFFMIPFSNQPGSNATGSAPAIRATRYGAGNLADTIQKLTAAGCEVGLHGIDAWRDSSSGRQELDEIRHLTSASEVGTRMHWLYFDQQSPFTLETAGAAYDSTIGYNGTVGYRAGTTQVYKPLNVSRLLELPLHVMDTALFYPSYLALSPKQAKALLKPMLDNVVRFGGAFTVNWHDRSLAPERLWGDFYGDLIHDLKGRGAWFATAGQATSWFRKRRAAEFDTNPAEPSGVRLKAAHAQNDNLPGLRLRVHKPGNSPTTRPNGAENYIDIAVSERIESGVTSEARL
jgi:peptidoglycan/xylan/chitin deacetylase (PgdA/CDA1 family)